AKGDLLSIEAQMASEEFNLLDSQNNQRLAYLDLAQLLELPTTEGFEIEVPELGLLEELDNVNDPNQIYTLAIDSRPEIKSAQLRLEGYDKGVQIAKGSLYPRLTLGGSWGTGYSGNNKYGEDPYSFIPQIGITESGESVYALSEITSYESFKTKSFNEQLDDNLNESLGFNLNIPIFNGWSSRYNIALAKIAKDQAELDLKLHKNTLYKTIQLAYNDAIAANNRHAAASKKVDATSESFRYAEQKYNVGLITSVEYNDAKKELNNAESELLQARYDYIFRLKILDFYMGKPLTLNR
ncbi:MAG: TolC family protein, partial [Bacteroidales bacterium]|nr:TolC family protein [Bacteroidales bacterium]